MPDDKISDMNKKKPPPPPPEHDPKLIERLQKGESEPPNKRDK